MQNEKDIVDKSNHSEEEETQERPENFNPYVGMLERLEQQRNAHIEETHEVVKEFRDTAKKMTWLIQLIAIAVLWIFMVQFFPFELGLNVINILGIITIIIFTVLVVVKLGKWIATKDSISIYLLIAFLGSCLIFQIIAFFVPTSNLYFVLVGVPILCACAILLRSDMFWTDRIVIVFIIFSIVFAGLHSARNLSIGKINIPKEREKAEYEKNPTGPYKIFGVELD